MFQQDLLAELRKWQEDGDQLALLLDVNEDVRMSQFSRALQAIQLTEANAHFHGPDLPATHCEGSLPIDGVYVSPTLLGTLRCGYLPVIQDHRALFIDIPQTVAFGYDAPESKRPQARRLKTNDPRLVEKYLDHFKSVVLKHHLPERAARLADAAQFPLTAAQAEEWEWIDSIRVPAMLEAEKKCRHLFMGETLWTPEYDTKRATVDLWNAVVRRLEGRAIDSKRIMRKASKLGLASTVRGISLAEAKQHRQEAYKAKNRYKKHEDISKRNTFIDGLAQAQADAGNIKKEQALLRLRTVEKQRLRSRVIRRARGKTRNGGLTFVIAPNHEGNWVEVTDKTAMEEALINELKKRFNQATATPFLQRPLFSDIGPLGFGQAAGHILEGSYTPPSGTDPWAAKLIHHLQRSPRPPHCERISDRITVDDHIHGWRKAREATSSGLSGVHFGHFIRQPWM